MIISANNTMAHILFSHSPYPGFHFQQQRVAGKIRLSIFLIAAECFGPPALVWALCVLHRHHKRGGRISVFIMMLLLCDLLELLLNPYVVMQLLQNVLCWKTSTTCRTFTSLWSGSKIYGFLLQQVVALEGALSLRHPHCSAQAFFNSCSIITDIIAFIGFFLCEFFSTSVLIVFILPLLLTITLISCIITCRAPPQISGFPSRTKKPSSTVLAFLTFAVILHVTFVIICTVMRDTWDLWVMGASLMSLRVITDPLLCALVYRKNLWVQETRAHVEDSTYIELTEIQSSDTPNTRG